jgi:ribose 5-phosphate isomerase B
MLRLGGIFMKIAVGADHAGFLLKQRIADELKNAGHEVIDRGTDTPDSCDYPDFAAAVGEDVTRGRAERGILVCGTGIGMSIAANKIQGIRAAIGTSEAEVRLARGHNDTNVLTLGARFPKEDTTAILKAFLTTPFDGGRHADRLSKIREIEQKSCKGD